MQLFNTVLEIIQEMDKSREPPGYLALDKEANQVGLKINESDDSGS
jgi:hypothetical protein